MNLINGGNLETQDLEYCFYLNLPIFMVNKEFVGIRRDIHRNTEISFPTKIMLTRQQNYFNISISIIGFGLGFSLEWR